MKKLIAIVLLTAPAFAADFFGPVNPVTCTPTMGLIFWNTTDNKPYVCTAADTWTSMAESGASGFIPYVGATSDVVLGAHTITGNPFTGDAGAGGTTGLVPAPAAGDAAKFLRGDATWQTAGGGSAFMGWTLTPPTIPPFAWDNQGAATTAVTGAGLAVTCPGGVSTSIRSLRVATTVPYTITLGFTLALRKGGATNTEFAGIALSDGTKLATFVWTSLANLGGYNYTNVTTYGGSNQFTTEAVQIRGPVLWLRIMNDGVNRIFSFSADGYTFLTLASAAFNSFLVENSVGFACASSNSADNSVYANVLSWTLTNP